MTIGLPRHECGQLCAENDALAHALQRLGWSLESGAASDAIATAEIVLTAVGVIATWLEAVAIIPAVESADDDRLEGWRDALAEVTVTFSVVRNVVEEVLGERGG